MPTMSFLFLFAFRVYQQTILHKKFIFCKFIPPSYRGEAAVWQDSCMHAAGSSAVCEGHDWNLN